MYEKNLKCVEGGLNQPVVTLEEDSDQSKLFGVRNRSDVALEGLDQSQLLWKKVSFSDSYT